MGPLEAEAEAEEGWEGERRLLTVCEGVDA